MKFNIINSLYLLLGILGGFSQIVFGSYLLPLVPITYFGRILLALGICGSAIITIYSAINYIDYIERK